MNPLLNRPAHGKITNNHGWCNVKDLADKSSRCVEDGGIQGTSEGSLRIGTQAVVNNASLCWRSCN